MTSYVQFTGAGLVLLAYYGANKHGWAPPAPLVFGMNLVGALLLMASALASGQWGFVLLNGAWAGVAVRGLFAGKGGENYAEGG